MVPDAMFRVGWTGSRPVPLSVMFSLPLRMFHACGANQMPTVPKDHPKYKEWRERAYAADRLRHLEDPIKAQEKDRKKSSKHYHSNADYRRRQAERSSTPHALAQKFQYRHQLAIKQKEGLRLFIRRRPHIWKHMTWKTHTPIFYDQGTKHRCATCNSHPYLGYKLWWKRNETGNHDSDTASDLYECHACFTADWSRAMPIGYEDFVFGQGKALRLRNTLEATTPSPDSKGKER